MDNIELYKALAKARTEFTKVKFDSVNPHFKTSLPAWLVCTTQLLMRCQQMV